MGDIKRMRESLSKILVHYYPLAGRLNITKSGRRLELDCNAKGAIFLEAESTKTMDEYGDFSPNESTKELIPIIDYTQPIEEIPLFVVQVTKIFSSTNSRDIGIAIGIVNSNPLADGLSYSRFLNAWAKVVRGDVLDNDEMFPVIDRSILKSTHLSLEPRFDHPELKPSLPFIIGNVDSKEEQKKKIIALNLKLSPEDIAKLKTMANYQSPNNGARPYTRYEAIVAHLWKCASKARQLDSSQPTRVRFLVNIRNRFNPPIPLNYFGTVTTPTVSPTCYIGEIISRPLSYAAQNIREGIELITQDHIWSQQDFIRGKNVLEEEDTPFYGKPNLSIVSWMGIPFDRLDFGWGKPTYFGPGICVPYDVAIIIGSIDKDDPITISMHFQEEHMNLFLKYFWQDLLHSRL